MESPLHHPLRGRSPSPFRGGFWPAILILWVIASLLYVWAGQGRIADWKLPDPDDELRLLQVRDWLAGQSWWDLAPHRMNPPFPAPMHWSRLVDLPIAAAILLARPFATADGAELFACIAAPLVTLGCTMLLMAGAARRLLGRNGALIVAALTPFSTATLQQMQVMRIDHHGWQIAMAAGMLLGILDRKALRGGVVAGLCAAIWIEISIEGLPLAAATGALFALRWLLAPGAERERLAGFALALAGGCAALFSATRAPGDWGIACDALSPAHLLPLALVATGATAATMLPRLPLAARVALLVAAAAGAALAYLSAAPQCQGGAFGRLDPLVFRFWYSNVPEGLPLWAQEWRIVLKDMGFPTVGLACALLLRRTVADRRRWDDYIVLLVASMLVTVMVQRAGGVANLLALPAGVAMMMRVVTWLQRVRAMLPRVFASAAAALALMPISPALVGAAVPDRSDPPARAVPGKAPPQPSCDSRANYLTAGRLPHALLLTSLDIAPGILLVTSQTAVASGHHRNAMGMHDAIASFVSPPAAAHAIIRRRGIGYIVVCHDLIEMSTYRDAAPRGLWAQLDKGVVPGWLRPVRIPGSKLEVWQVVG